MKLRLLKLGAFLSAFLCGFFFWSALIYFPQSVESLNVEIPDEIVSSVLLTDGRCVEVITLEWNLNNDK